MMMTIDKKATTKKQDDNNNLTTFPTVDKLGDDKDTLTSVSGINIGRLVNLDDLGFNLLWDEQNLPDQVVAAGQLAGHIALHNPINPGRVNFYDSRGVKLHTLQLPSLENAKVDSSERIIYMCWNNPLQHLIILTESGVVYFRDATGANAAASSVRLSSSPHAWAPTDHGLVIVIGSGDTGTSYELVNLSCTQLLEEYTVRHFTPARGMAQVPQAMVNITSTLAVSGCDETYFVVNPDDGQGSPPHVDRIVWRSSRASAAQYTALSAPYEFTDAVSCMCVSPDGKAIGILLADCTVLCCRPDFRQTKTVGQALDVSGLNYQFEWFGNDALALINHSEFDCLGTLFSVRLANGSDGSDAKSIEVELPMGSWALVEPDGLRLVAGCHDSRDDFSAHRFWQVIPSEVIAFYQRGTSRAASSCTQLRVAYNAFRNGDAECAAIIKNLSAPGSTEKLVQAITDTLQVACFEWHPERQRNLLRVASYGKVFCSVFDSQRFFDVCRRARVAHSLRKNANIIASLHQLRLLDGEPLINRLVNIGLFSLACDVAAVLGLRNDSILERWAVLEISSAKTRDLHISEIRAFLEGLMKRGNFELEPAINAAVDNGLPREALAELIRMEKRTDKRMHYYIQNCKLHSEFAELALEGAALSGDSDVLFDCLMQVPISRELLSRMPDISGHLDSTAAMLVRFSPGAIDADQRLRALSAVLNDHDPFFSVSLALQQYFLENARLKMEVQRGTKGRVATALGTMRSSIQGAAIAVQQASSTRNHRTLSVSSSHAQVGKMDDQTKETVHRLEQQENLVKEQQGLFDQTQNEGFLNASIAKTLSLCVQLDMAPKADRLADEYKVSKKMLAWARLNGAIARGKESVDSNFDAAYRLIDQWFGKECVIGYVNLVQALVDADQPQFAALYIRKVSPLEERLEFYVKCKKWREAAEDCKKEGQPQYIQQLRARAGGDSRALSEISSVGV